MDTSKISIWAKQIRAPFLLLSVVLCLIGGAVALHDGVFDGLHLLLCVVGVTLAHVAVNLFNELSDSRTGVDDHTVPTPFSGGSKTLQRGLLTPRAVTRAAWATLLGAGLIGLYLTWASGWVVAALMLAGGVTSVLYTSHLARWAVGELAAGTTLGSFVVLGTYYAQVGHLTPTILLLSIPAGVLTALLLLLNEFPDVEADRAGARRHLVILLGFRQAAGLYTGLLGAMYLFIGAGVLLRWFPPILLITFLTLPFAVKASVTALRHGSEPQRMVPALGANVALVLGTDLLIATAYLIQYGVR